MAVDFGLVLVERQPRGPQTAWLDNLERVLPPLSGHFRSLWMTDHLFWQDWYTLEVWTVLSYLAAKYPAFHVGSMVMCQSYRNPALLAKMAASLQVLSGGRLLLGVGAGWKEDEYRGYGYAFPSPGTRVEQLEDTLEIINRLWKEPGQITYHGKHYHVENAYCEPKPDPLPPLIVGGGGNKTMLLAARYADWWNISDKNYAIYSGLVATLRQHCETIGRDPASLHPTWFGRIALGKTEAEAQALASTDLVPWTRDNAFVGTPQQVVEQMQPFLELGVNYFMLDVLGLSTHPDVTGLLLEDVLPHIRGK